MKGWSFKYHYCGGNSQSPVDIQFNKSRPGHHLKQLQIKELYSRGKLTFLYYVVSLYFNLLFILRSIGISQ